MKDAMNLLEAIGYIQDEYILDAHNGKTVRKHRKAAMIAVAAAILVLLAGCVFAWHWYDHYFSQKHQAPLSGEQLEYIHSNAVDYRERQSYGGYTLELKSTISESSTAYVTFQLTAPETVDLSPVWDIRSEDRLSFRGLLAKPENSTLPADLTYDVVDDGDGQNNTVNVVLQIRPMLEAGEEPPFGAGKWCSIEFKEILYHGFDSEYAKEFTQKDQMLTPEQSIKLHPETVLATGEWSFRVELKETDAGSRELLTEPVFTVAMVSRTGDDSYLPVDSVEKVKLVSVRVSPLSMEITFEPPEPAASFEGLYLDVSQAVAPGVNHSGYEEILLGLKDGTQIHFFQYDGAKSCAVLKADSPIVLSEIDYVRFSDGTVIRAK